MDRTTVRRILIVANRTAGGVRLREAMLARALERPTEFMLVVPATPAATGWTWTESDARSLAGRRLRLGMRALRSVGIEVAGTVGDFDPVEAVGDAVRRGRFDELVVSTLPAGASRWLRQDLPSRLRRRFGLPVTVVTADETEPPVQATRGGVLAGSDRASA